MAALMLAGIVDAQVLARITVKAGAFARQHTLLSLDLDGITDLSPELLALYQTGGKQPGMVLSQTEPGVRRRLWWQMEGEMKPGETRSYELRVAGKVALSSEPVKLTDQDGALVISADHHQVLQYNYKTVYPPAGIDTAFKRSGFIHPAWSPEGRVLTGIHPKDHYHHVGIWNPWTDTEFEGKEVDFWNLKKLSGTVRFVHFISQTSGLVWGGFKALQAHVVLGGKSGPDKTAMNEVWDVRAYRSNGKLQVWDFVSILSCATASPIELRHYRYGGGFAIRGNPEWNNENSKVLTSEGKTRKDADSTRAKWFKVAGDLKSGKAGILILSSPDNFSSPQPIRVWPEKDQGGQVFAEFSPTKDYSWKLTPGNEYSQKYRVVMFDGDITASVADALWNDYAHPPEVTVQRVSR